MKYKQIKLRIEMIIQKDRQTIRGYNLVITKVKGVYKRSGYKSVIKRLKTSIERKLQALRYIEDSSSNNHNWKDICKKFKFRAYKQ